MTDATPDQAAEMAARSGLWRLLRRVLVLVVGVPVALLGVALLVAPGPGTPILLAGLAILATEFRWAQRQMDRLRTAARRLLGRSSTGDDI